MSFEQVFNKFMHEIECASKRLNNGIVRPFDKALIAQMDKKEIKNIMIEFQATVLENYTYDLMACSQTHPESLADFIPKCAIDTLRKGFEQEMAKDENMREKAIDSMKQEVLDNLTDKEQSELREIIGEEAFKLMRANLSREIRAELEETMTVSSTKSTKSTKSVKPKREGEPKRPKNAYFLFCDSVREGVKRENPGLKAHELSPFLVEKYKEAKAGKTAEFAEIEKQAEVAKAAYNKQLAEFNAEWEGSHPGETVATAKKTRKTGSAPKGKRQDAYGLFCDYMREELCRSEPSLLGRERLTKINLLWKNRSNRDPVIVRLVQKAGEMKRGATEEPAPSKVRKFLIVDESDSEDDVPLSFPKKPVEMPELEQAVEQVDPQGDSAPAPVQVELVNRARDGSDDSGSSSESESEDENDVAKAEALKKAYKNLIPKLPVVSKTFASTKKSRKSKNSDAKSVSSRISASLFTDEEMSVAETARDDMSSARPKTKKKKRAIQSDSETDTDCDSENDEKIKKANVPSEKGSVRGKKSKA